MSFLGLCPRFAWLAMLFTSSHALAQLTLDEKLERQWAKYQLAQDELIKRVGCKDAPMVSRDEWEKLLSPAADEKLSAQDLQALKNRQKQIIDQAQKTSLDASAKAGIDFKNIRKLGKVEEICADLPKGAMLHIHPLGTISEETAAKLLKSFDPTINRDRILSAVSADGASFSLRERECIAKLPVNESFSKLTPEQQSLVVGLVVLPAKEVHPFSEFQAKFSYIDAILYSQWPKNDPAPLVTADFLERANKSGVQYVELTRGCPQSAADLLKFSDAAQASSEASGVGMRYNCSFVRTANPEVMGSRAATLFKNLQSLQGQEKSAPRLVGIDLLGSEDPADNPGRDVSALGAGQRIYSCLAEMKKNGLKLRATMHSGEHGDLRNPRDAMIMGVDRIGHGVRLNDDPVALEYARKRALPIETNLVSNRRLKAVDSYDKHPYLKFLRLGLPISLSTDDEGIFETSIENECVQAVKKTDLNYAEMKSMIYNSISTSFATEAEKHRFKSRLDSEFAAFENKWSANTVAGQKNLQAPKLAKAKPRPPRNPCMEEEALKSAPGHKHHHQEQVN